MAALALMSQAKHERSNAAMTDTPYVTEFAPYVTEFMHSTVREFRSYADAAMAVFNARTDRLRDIGPLHHFQTRRGVPAYTIRIAGAWYTHILAVSSSGNESTL